MVAGPHHTVLTPVNDNITLVAHHTLGKGQQPDDQIQDAAGAALIADLLVALGYVN